MRKVFIYFFLSVFSLSCTHTFKEYDKDSFSDYIWKSGEEIAFNPVIDDVSKSYQLTLGIRHVYGLPLEKLNLTVKTIAPSGEVLSNNYTLEIKDSRNNYTGSCAGDLCDLEVVVEETLMFKETGSYRYLITHNIEKLPGILEFGLILDAN